MQMVLVEPFAFGDGRVAVDDGGAASVFGGPVVAADGEAEFIGFAGGFAVQGELADFAGASAFAWTLSCPRERRRACHRRGT